MTAASVARRDEESAIQLRDECLPRAEMLFSLPPFRRLRNDIRPKTVSGIRQLPYPGRS
jgi:hypothetical protein